MRIRKLLHIGDNLLCKFDIVQRIAVLIGAPRIKMHLVYIHRRFIDIGFGFLFKPLCILPFVGGFIELRRILRRGFKMCAVGIVLELYFTGFCQNAVFVYRIHRELIDCRLPDAVRDRQHGVRVAVPFVEIADDGNINRIRCPDAEHGLFHAVTFLGMCTEKALRIKVFALIEKVKRKRIRIPVCLFVSHRFLP